MRWFIFLGSLMLLLLPTLSFSSTNKKVIITITPSYPLNPVSAQLICTSLYTNLPSTALRNIERLKGTPYSCKLDTSTSNKQLVIAYIVKDPATV